MTFAYRLVAAILLCAALTAPARAESAAIKAMQDYMEFAPYEAGIIVPQQLAKGGAPTGPQTAVGHLVARRITDCGSVASR